MKNDSFWKLRTSFVFNFPCIFNMKKLTPSFQTFQWGVIYHLYPWFHLVFNKLENVIFYGVSNIIFFKRFLLRKHSRSRIFYCFWPSFSFTSNTIFSIYFSTKFFFCLKQSVLIENQINKFKNLASMFGLSLTAIFSTNRCWPTSLFSPDNKVFFQFNKFLFLDEFTQFDMFLSSISFKKFLRFSEILTIFLFIFLQ